MRLDPRIKCDTCRLLGAKVTVAELAELLLLTPERVRQLIKAGVIRKERDGIPMQDALAAYVEYLRGDCR